MNVNVPAVVSNLFGGKKEETTQESTSTSQSATGTLDTSSSSQSSSQLSSDSKDPSSSPQFDSVSKSTTSSNSTSDPVSRDTQAGLTEMDESKETTTNAAVQHEHIRKTHEEKMHEVVDKERHQDHFHTTVQPLKDSEVKPEEHNYKEGATENRSFNHEDSAETKAKLEAEKARFQNTVSEGSTAESKTNEGVVAGEDKIIHHHHEIIQPVIEKETVKPSVTHTTIPVKETHQDPSVVHGTSTAEPMSVDEFKSGGNKLNTAEEATAKGEKVGIQPMEKSSPLSFIQGFFLGQISIAILIALFIKFFIFGEIPEQPPSRSRRLSSHTASRLAPKKSTSALRPIAPLSSASILSKTYYNVKSHQPESVDWFNVLIAQTIAQLRNDAQQDEAILTTLNLALNGDKRPDFLDTIKVTEINLGEEFPIFSNCRIMPVDSTLDGNQQQQSSGVPMVDGGPRLQARMDVDLADNITLGIETKLVLNYPKPMVAVMPVALAVSVVRFSGTLSISFIPSPSSSGNAESNGSTPAPGSTIPPSPTILTFSFQPDYRLELSTRSLLGSRSRLQDVPKIAQLVESRLHSWFDERCVEPKFQRVVLPSLWPRRRNVGLRSASSGEHDPDQHISDHLKGNKGDFALDGGGGELRNRRQRPSTTNPDQQYHHLPMTEPRSFELPASMPGRLPT